MSRPIAIVTTTEEKLDELVFNAVCKALTAMQQKAAAGGERLSLRAAAKSSRTRSSTVMAALHSGALRGVKSGRDWNISAAHLREWVESGRPITIFP